MMVAEMMLKLVDFLDGALFFCPSAGDAKKLQQAEQPLLFHLFCAIRGDIRRRIALHDFFGAFRGSGAGLSQPFLRRFPGRSPRRRRG